LRKTVLDRETTFTETGFTTPTEHLMDNDATKDALIKDHSALREREVQHHPESGDTHMRRIYI